MISGKYGRITLAPLRRRRVSTTGWLVLGACVASSLGCYKYVPTTIESVPVGAHVKAAISAEAQDDLRSRVGLDLPVLEGEVIEENGDKVLLSVKSAKVESEFGARSLYQRVDVSRGSIVRVDVRQLDKPRTYGLIGAAAGVAALIVTQAFGESDPGSPNPPGNPPADHKQGFLFWVPVLRW